MVNIIKIAEELENSHQLEAYWDYRDKLSEEQALKLIVDKEGLDELTEELETGNLDYIDQTIKGVIKDLKVELTEEEEDELIDECRSRFNLNINGLIKNSQINIRLELHTNEDMINFTNEGKGSEGLRDFKRVFKGKYEKQKLKEEIDNAPEFALFTFYFKIKGENILNLREQILNGYITLKKGSNFGLFNSWIGGGSLLDISLTKKINLNLKDWRVRSKKEEVLNGLSENKNGYYNIQIKADNISKYGIQETYGLVSFPDY